VRRHLQVAKSLPQLNLQAAAAPHPPATAVAADAPQDADSSNTNASSSIKQPSTYTVTTSDAASQQASGILQLDQFSSPQQLHATWQQQLAPACRAAWGHLRTDTTRYLQLQLDPDSQQQQQQQQQEEEEQAWSPSTFLLELDLLLGQLQEVRAAACRTQLQ
jgi:hypothetical protein